MAGAEGEDHGPDDQSQNVGARHHHNPHPEQIDRAGHQIDMTFFHASGQQRDGEGAEQGNEGGDPGDNRRQLGIPDVIMEEVHQGPGLKEKGTPHQKDIAGEDPPRTIGAQTNPGAFQGHALPGKGDLFFDVAKAHQQEKGRQYAKNHRGIEESLLLVAFA
ncbi:Uncharacterised protein [Klebsiella pneumoniae]|nr:Uncharacterised protein [Klebsiella pneumoniae]